MSTPSSRPRELETGMLLGAGLAAALFGVAYAGYRYGLRMARGEQQPRHEEDADLSKSLFRDVKLNGAQFDDVEAQNAIFTNVRFKGSRFEDVDLTNAQFSDAHIEGARVNGVPLQDALDAYRHQQQAR